MSLPRILSLWLLGLAGAGAQVPDPSPIQRMVLEAQTLTRIPVALDRLTTVRRLDQGDRLAPGVPGQWGRPDAHATCSVPASSAQPRQSAPYEHLYPPLHPQLR